ncbi:hypothetical protein ACFXKF_32965 [Streptomyces scopuliridis]|uniref:hypothetical protein n=1 Tax=Streptomyces scopuliridis TaxID=452529 RepID=UPI0036C8658F
MITVVVATVALAFGYLLGRIRPWEWLSDWAADEVRFTGAWVQGGTGRQMVVVLAHAVTAPRTSWRVMRSPSTETRVPAPVRDPNWVTNHTREDGEGSA